MDGQLRKQHVDNYTTYVNSAQITALCSIQELELQQTGASLLVS